MLLNRLFILLFLLFRMCSSLDVFFFHFRLCCLNRRGYGINSRNRFLLFLLFGLIPCVHLPPFLLVSRKDDRRHILPLPGFRRVDDGIERQVGPHELESAADPSGETSHRQEIRSCSQAPADSFFYL